MTYIATHSVAHRLPAQRFIGLSAILGLWRTRRQLRALDDHALADIGLSRAEAEAEASRPIWDVPANWRD